MNNIKVYFSTLFLCLFLVLGTSQTPQDRFLESHPDYKYQDAFSSSNGTVKLDSIIVTNENLEVIERSLYAYDNQNRLIQFLYYAVRDGELRPIWEYLYEYNNENQLTRQEQWTAVNGVLSPYILEVYQYNPEGLQERREYFNFDPVVSRYIESRLETFTYEQGLLQRIDISNYDKEKGVYEQFRYLDLEYNENNQETLRTETNVIDVGIEFPSARFTRQYDNDKLVAFNFDIWINKWAPFQRTKIDYDRNLMSKYELASFNPNQPDDTTGVFTITHESDPSGLVVNRTINIKNDNGLTEIRQGELTYNEGLRFSELVLPFTLNDAFYGYELLQAQLLQESYEITNSNGENEGKIHDYFWSSALTSTNNVTNIQDIQIWPNPSIDEIQWDVTADLQRYMITSASGQVLQVGQNKGKIKVRSLPPGPYSLILLGNEEVAVGQWVKK